MEHFAKAEKVIRVYKIWNISHHTYSQILYGPLCQTSPYTFSHISIPHKKEKLLETILKCFLDVICLAYL